MDRAEFDRHARFDLRELCGSRLSAFVAFGLLPAFLRPAKCLEGSVADPNVGLTAMPSWQGREISKLPHAEVGDGALRQVAAVQFAKSLLKRRY